MWWLIGMTACVFLVLFLAGLCGMNGRDETDGGDRRG